MVTLTWHALPGKHVNLYKVHKLHQRYILWIPVFLFITDFVVQEVVLSTSV